MKSRQYAKEKGFVTKRHSQEENEAVRKGEGKVTGLNRYRPGVGSTRPAEVLALQQTVGNRATVQAYRIEEEKPVMDKENPELSPYQRDMAQGLEPEPGEEPSYMDMDKFTGGAEMGKEGGPAGFADNEPDKAGQETFDPDKLYGTQQLGDSNDTEKVGEEELFIPATGGY